ncbi:SGNH/GDSL hydrolase family protein [Dysgonomonas termitidis]|uniref:SGNH hydrolase-type esterase domain-containing protein n=1 Tax=Dysgonomonas termitidis TaxID=1516126 RepID=A0ABV9KSX4_9BACT
MSTSNNSYFGKAILFVALSIAAFLVFKEVLPERLFSEHVEANENILMDSMALMAQSDTTEIHDIPVIEPDSTKVQAYEEVDANFNPALTADGYQNLNRFYTKLHELQETKTGKVRIAYFGDSMNDGDYIVQDVRSEFQENYGGEGVGYVAVSSLSAGARGSISHQYSKNWFSQSFVKVKKPMKPFGIDGQVFFAKDPAQTYWVRYKAQSQKHSTQLNNPVLLYGRGNNSKAYVTVAADKDSVSSKILNPVNLLNTLSLSSHNAKSIQVNFHNADSIPIYGFNFDNGEGVHVDNFSTRGNSGLPLSILNPALMNAFDKVLNYDLIILHYGANVLGYGSLNYNWYERNMTTVVNNLHECFPNADILVISTADRALKIDGTMQTDPAVVPLANAQRNYARKTNSGFISLYEVMGGKGSMVTWVDNKLANKDYTHFNGSGSKKVAKLIYSEIDKGYTKFKAKQ